MKPTETILKVENLRTSFLTSDGSVQAVRGTSFDLGKGEVLGIVGESGSGKTVTSLTILRLLAENAIVEDGRIFFEEKDLITLSKKEMRKVRGARISMIFQDPMTSLNPLIPIGKQVEEMLAEHEKLSGKELRDEALRLLELVRIPEASSRYKAYPHEFSGGMRQRVMIAMALACKPDVLIADEPTTALDVTIQDQILKLLNRLKEELHMAIIFITHDLGVVAEICDRVIVMYGGSIMEEGSIYDIFENPSHPYTRGLLQSMPDITADKSRRLVSIPGSPPDMLHPPEGCPFVLRCGYARNACAAMPPEGVLLSEGHRSFCFLLHPDAPAENNPFKTAAVEIPAAADSGFAAAVDTASTRKAAAETDMVPTRETDCAADMTPAAEPDTDRTKDTI